MSGTAVLAMAYGTPASLADLEDYYTHIRRGRPPSREQLDELRARYAAIGGHSPLLEITRAQAAGLERELALAGRPDVHVALGMKHAAPFIEDAVAELVDAGARRILGIVLAPHYSRLSVGEYADRARAAAGDAELTVVPSWHLAPGYLDVLAAALRDTLASLPTPAHVLFTAHSLPTRILDEDDPYPEQLRETAAAVAARAGAASWSIAWQSAGRTPEPWIGPDILTVLEQLACVGTQSVAVCPAGFVADHLEVLYDLDIEAHERARELGIAFARTASPNAHPRLMQALAGVVTHHLALEPAPA